MKKNKKWSEFTPGQKIVAIVAGIIQVGLLLSALWDIIRRPKDEFRGSKWMWMGIVFINFIGPITYFVFGRKPDSQILVPLPEDDN